MLKSLALRFLLLPGAEALFAPFARGRAVVFMLHRFRSPEHPNEGYDAATVRRALAHLRRERYRILSIEELVRAAIEERIPDRAVAFTIDDGYLDHATIAGPVFAEFDCPVTAFVTSGFLDGDLWFWWDRIEYVFRTTRRRVVSVALPERSLEYRWDNEAGRLQAQKDFTEQCKQISDFEKHEAITQLAAAAGVDLPDTPPSEYAPMSWDQLRACEQRGMTFGPHTVTHPVLSRVTADRSCWEITESWRRLREEARAPVPVFCYPNGRSSDFSQREIATLEQLGFLGAVVGSEGIVSSRATLQANGGAFAVRRYPFPEELPRFVQYVSGAECVRAMLRGEPV